MTAPTLPPLLSSDGHLEVLPERWTPRMPAKYRERAPRTVKLPAGSDAILREGKPVYEPRRRRGRARALREAGAPGRQPRRVPERQGVSAARGRPVLGGRDRHEDAADGARRLRSPGPARVAADVRVPGRRSGGPQEARAAQDRGVDRAAVPEHPARHQPRAAGHVRRLRSPAGPPNLLRRVARRLGTVLDGGGRLLVRAPPPLGAAPAARPAADAAAERLRAPARLVQPAARRARRGRAASPHRRRAHHVRDRLPAHRVRLAEHAPLRRAALRRRAGRRGLQDRGGQHARVLPARGHAGGQDCAGAGGAGRHARLDRNETVMFQLRKLGHVVLNVTDLEASVRFYTEVLGLSISDRYPDSMVPGGMVFMCVSTDHHGVALVGGASKLARSTLNHFAFEVGSPDEVFRARAWLRKHDVPIVFEGRRRAGCQLAIEFRDPDGNNLEIYWGIDQVGTTGGSRPATEWRPARSLEDAVANPVAGQRLPPVAIDTV